MEEGRAHLADTMGQTFDQDESKLRARADAIDYLRDLARAKSCASYTPPGEPGANSQTMRELLRLLVRRIQNFEPERVAQLNQVIDGLPPCAAPSSDPTERGP